MTSIRRATIEDGPACARIVHGWVTSVPWLPAPPGLETLTGHLTKGIATQDIWVAGDPVAGYLSFGPNEALIRGFYTASPGSGVGKALLDHIKQGKDWLQLWTHAPNTRAHDFYLREGFVMSGQSRDGDDDLKEVHMTWRATR